MIINDHVLTEFICNLRCIYCSGKIGLTRKNGKFLETFFINNALSNKESVSDFLSRNLKIIKLSRYQKKTPILKLSGGEIFLIPEFINMLPFLAREYLIIQILTNGVLLDFLIVKKLKKFHNIQLQVSLDGHTIEMNSCRFTSVKTLAKIINNLILISKFDIPLEINCVLTRINIDNFFEFVKKINSLVKKCTIYPFPVRSHRELFPLPLQIEVFALTLKEKFSSFKHLLPPIQYFNSLVEFMKNRKRTKGCYIPYLILATNGNGLLDVCTCGTIKNLGNVLSFKNRSENPYFKIEQDPCYNKIISPKLAPACCKECFSHYDVINLFLEDLISVAELKTMPFFATEEIIDRLIEAKNEKNERGFTKIF